MIKDTIPSTERRKSITIYFEKSISIQPGANPARSGSQTSQITHLDHIPNVVRHKQSLSDFLTMKQTCGCRHFPLLRIGLPIEDPHKKFVKLVNAGRKALLFFLLGSGSVPNFTIAGLLGSRHDELE